MTCYFSRPRYAHAERTLSLKAARPSRQIARGLTACTTTRYGSALDTTQSQRVNAGNLGQAAAHGGTSGSKMLASTICYHELAPHHNQGLCTSTVKRTQRQNGETDGHTDLIHGYTPACPQAPRARSCMALLLLLAKPVVPTVGTCSAGERAL